MDGMVGLWDCGVMGCTKTRLEYGGFPSMSFYPTFVGQKRYWFAGLYSFRLLRISLLIIVNCRGKCCNSDYIKYILFNHETSRPCQTNVRQRAAHKRVRSSDEWRGNRDGIRLSVIGVRLPLTANLPSTHPSSKRHQTGVGRHEKLNGRQ